MKQGFLRNKDIIYPELCFQIVGCAFDVFNNIGSGHKESVYQKALMEAFKAKELEVNQQVYTKVKFNGKVIGKSYMDFVINSVIIVEIKRTRFFSIGDIEQCKNYLRSLNLKLAILINFNPDGVFYKRIVNLEK